MRIAVIGDTLFIKAFELIGSDGFKAENEKEIINILKKVIEQKEYGLIIIPERYVKATKPIRERLIKAGSVTPLFAFLSDYTGETGQRIEELKKLISLAVGIQLKL
ncbi:MAG: V-type ATP synthase subunit F [Candidatus Njordarchaeia archaeon]